MTSIFWFRRDLRLQDNEALAAAFSEPGGVAGVYMLDKSDYLNLEGIRQHSLSEGLRSLSNDMGNTLHIIEADSIEAFSDALLNACLEIEAKVVFATESFDPKGIKEQLFVAKFLESQGISLLLLGSAYAVRPGTVRKPDGTNYRVYTPFYKAWVNLADATPKKLTKDLKWLSIKQRTDIPSPTKASPFKVIAGEAFASRTFDRFKARALDDYDQQRNRADLSGTSHLSHAQEPFWQNLATLLLTKSSARRSPGESSTQMSCFTTLTQSMTTTNLGSRSLGTTQEKMPRPALRLGVRAKRASQWSMLECDSS